MGILKKIAVGCILIVSSAFCFAKQISFQIVQHDESLEAVGEQALVIEDEIITGLFNYGYIVTNSEAAVSSSESQDEKLWNVGLGEAFDGYSDYFVQIKLYYTSPEKNVPASKAVLKNVEWSISNAKTGTVLKSYSINSFESKSVSSDIIVAINKIIKANKA